MKGQPSTPTAAEATEFLARANARLLDLTTKANRASWVQSTYITDDTEELSADRERKRIAATMELAAESVRFDGVDLPADDARQLSLIKQSVATPAPANAEDQAELTRTIASMQGTFGRGRYDGRDLTDLERLLSESRDADERLDAWRGWRTIAPPLRRSYERFVELANEGARELGYADMGAQWRSAWDMDPDAFAAEMERLWRQLEPMYDSLHRYARTSLVREYGPDVVPVDGNLPAHLLGNMWSQDWSGMYPLLAPDGWAGDVDVTSALRARKVDEVEMVRFADRFFTSLGFDPMPPSFWERSLFRRPSDRLVECHPSAWDIDADLDLRLKYCIEITAEHFNTIHHELGHLIYDRAYRTQPFLFREGANAGFHEAVGDAVSLSITARYLVDVGLIDHEPPMDGDLPFLLRIALERLPVLPFAMALETWRWRVFSGEIAPADYNVSWWELVEAYQRVSPPSPPSEADFDPGSKYHVPANVAYAPYFIAFVLEFQFHRAFARQAGWTGPLHRFSIHGNTAVGAKLAEMLAMGRSRPWPDALFALTGERDMDATAVLDYFAPLKAWLDEQNAADRGGG